MSINVSGSNHREWNAYGLADNPAEFAEYVNQTEYGDGQLEGEWYDIPEEPVSVLDGDGERVYRVIYSGTFGNYNSPGAYSYTFADLYDVADEDDMAEYADRVAELQSLPEYLPTDDEDESEDESAD